MIRAIDVPAPARLHDRVREMVDARGEQPQRRPAPFGGLRLRLGAAATVLAAGLAALVLALAGSGGAELSLAQASAVTLRPATMPAPRESGGTTLAASVEGVSFPYWGERFGWSSTGSRVDRVGGRTFHTVFYSDGRGRTVGYAIVAGRAPALSAAGTVHWRGGTAFRVGRAGGVEVITWKRGGRLCVVSGRGVSGPTLLVLASWDERGGVA